MEKGRKCKKQLKDILFEVGKAIKGKEDHISGNSCGRAYFADNYVYTLHLGKPIDNEDEITRYLFDTKKGYCTHFASAAVMIFRTYGVPVRLAQGYMIRGSRLKRGEEVNVLDSNAHAWVEVYIKEKGWIPIDVTLYTNDYNDNYSTESEKTTETTEQDSSEPQTDVTKEPEPTDVLQKEDHDDTDDVEKDFEDLKSLNGVFNFYIIFFIMLRKILQRRYGKSSKNVVW